MEALTRYLSEERGRLVKLAEALDIFPSAISQWSRVPIDRVNDVARLTGIPREELRPDVFCPQSDATTSGAAAPSEAQTGVASQVKLAGEPDIPATGTFSDGEAA